MILAPVLVHTIDLHCVPQLLQNRQCSIDKQSSVPVYNASEINIVVPVSQKDGDIENIFIRFHPSQMPYPQNLHNRFPNVKEVTIISNIGRISRENFQGASKLTKLDLQSNVIDIIPVQVFTEAKNLIEINLFGNKIHFIEDLAFDGLVQLKRLELRRNLLTKIRNNTFAGLTALEELYLSDNRILEIEEGALNFPKLNTLYLAFNQLWSLPDWLFVQVPKLHTLHLEKNNIQRINNALESAYKLEILDLEANPIEDAGLVKFSKFVNLRELSVKNLPFNYDNEHIKPEDIKSTKSRIIKLNLSGCRIQSGVIFSKLKLFPHLEEVYLEDIAVNTVDLEEIRMNGGLRKLHIIKLRKGNYFSNEWLQRTTAQFGMTLTNDEIIVYQ